VDTETTEIVLPVLQKEADPFDPAGAAGRLAKVIADTVRDKYPLKGRVALVDGDKTIINLGKKHGVMQGLVFNVLGQGVPIELNGKILGYEETKLGQIEITEVQDQLAYAKVVERSGTWQKNTRVIQKK
jgi:hypothetical protein